MGWWNFLELLLIVAAILSMIFGSSPSNYAKQQGAMEVYKGNTKLEYKMVDSVKVDSCVIFLNKK